MPMVAARCLAGRRLPVDDNSKPASARSVRSSVAQAFGLRLGDARAATGRWQPRQA